MAYNKELIDLLVAMQECLHEEILPNLPKESSYKGAMMRRALAIVHREVLLDSRGSDGLVQARLIRKRRYESVTKLVAELGRMVRLELSINSPSFLERLDSQIDSVGHSSWVFKPELLSKEREC